MFDDKTLKTQGMVTLTVRHPTTKHEEMLDFYIAETHKQPLIGLEACLQFDLLSVNEENICVLQPETLTKESLLRDYADIFDGYGKLTGQLHLEVDPSVPQVRMPLRKLPIPIKSRVEAELKKLCDDAIIAQANEPTDWISALLVVNKPNGGIRL